MQGSVVAGCGKVDISLFVVEAWAGKITLLTTGRDQFPGFEPAAPAVYASTAKNLSVLRLVGLGIMLNCSIRS